MGPSGGLAGVSGLGAAVSVRCRHRSVICPGGVLGVLRGRVRAAIGKLAAAHAAEPPSRSVALTRPGLCTVAAAKLGWKPSLQIGMSGRAQSLIWGCRHCDAGSQRYSSELRGRARAAGISSPALC
jgi:hypothetical protein